MFTPVKFQTRLLLGSWKVCAHIHVWGHVVRERRVPLQVAPFIFGDAPIAPARKVPARCELQVAADVGRKLVDQLNDLNRLHDRKHHSAIVLAHHDFGGAAKSSTNCD